MAPFVRSTRLVALLTLAGCLATGVACSDAATGGAPPGRILYLADDAHLTVMREDGRLLTRLPVSARNDARWSPDGRRLATAREVGSHAQILTMREDGSEAVQLTHDTTDASMPSWSPDGTRIAFHRVAAGGTGNEVWVMNADGSDERRVAGDAFAPAYGPGERLAFSGTSTAGGVALFILDLATGARERITPVANGSAHGAAWSRDGRIAYGFDASPGERAAGAPAHEIRVYDPRTRMTRTVRAENGASLNHPIWSPDGRRILFTRLNLLEGSSIWTMRDDGTDVREVPVVAGYEDEGREALGWTAGR